MPDFVVRKKDGRPSYQPACVVDDAFYNINRIGRGEDLLPSTAAQAVLSEMMGYPPLFDRISFVHHPLVLGRGGEKLSKSAGSTGVSGTVGAISSEEVWRVAREWGRF